MKFFENMTVSHYYWFMGILCLILLLVSAFFLGRWRHKRLFSDKKTSPALLLVSMTFLILCLFTGVKGIGTYHTAHKYSANLEPRYATQSMKKFKYNIAHGFAKKMPKQFKPGDAIIIYRYGCPDCMNYHKQIQKAFPESRSNIYYVSSRSDYGQQMSKRYGVREVPTVLYYQKNDRKVYMASLVENHKLAKANVNAWSSEYMKENKVKK